MDRINHGILLLYCCCTLFFAPIATGTVLYPLVFAPIAAVFFFCVTNRALKHGDLPEDERREVAVTWLMQCVRGSEHILKREGIDIPQEIFGTDKQRPQNIVGYRVR